MKKKSNLWLWVKTSLLVLLVICAYSCSVMSDSEDDADKFSYLAVQMEKDGNWSIIDGDGKVIVKDEYPADNAIWIPTPKGVYWVKAKNKFSLYSVDSPKKPLTSVDYDDVTDFNNGRAFVPVFGEPIQMIDENGKVIKTLSEDISFVQAFSDGMAAYRSKNKDLWGFLNKDAEVIVKPSFTYYLPYYDGYAVGQDDSKKWKVVDKDGKIVEDWGKSKYICVNKYSDGVFCAVDTTDWSSLCYMDNKGNVAVKPAKKAVYRYGFNCQRFHKGTAIVFDEDRNSGLIDKEGNFLIRYGKYKSLNRLSRGLFSATNSNGNAGVIDKDENIVVSFNYSDWGGLSLGDNFLLKQGSYYVLVDADGKELKNCEYANFAINGNSLVQFVNIKSNIKAIVDLFSSNGFKPLNGKTDMPSIAKKYNLNLDDIMMYTRYFSTDVQVGEWSATAELFFDEYLKTELYHTEVQNDGWVSNEVTVSDGYGWNKDAILEKVIINVSVPSDIAMEDLIERIRKSFIENGFKEEGSILQGKYENGTSSLSIISDGSYLRVEFIYGGK